MKNFAVILSGCGFKDGAEITESVSTLIALSSHNVNYDVFAPDKTFTACNHINDSNQDQRNILEESARISRGKVFSLKELDPSKYDALVMPGGFGAAKELCNWAQKGANCEVDPTLENHIVEFHKQSKPIAAFCIAPVLLAKTLGRHGANITIGNDKETAAEIEKTGACHIDCQVTDFVSDRENKLITSPAYMFEATPFEVYTGIDKAIKELVEMA